MANRIAKLRKKKGLSQANLAQEVGISRPYLSDIETGKYKNPGSLLLFRLAKVLGVNAEDIFFDLDVSNTEHLNHTGTDDVI